MTQRKKARAKQVPKGKKTTPEAMLHVEVLQFGYPQAVGTWTSKRFFAKEISFGVGQSANLHLPYTKLPSKVRIFEIRGGKVFVVLDPRVEGFVNRGHEFGDVREFLQPRGALAEVATVDDPLHLELKPGSRGSVRIYGFEVIFKYDILPPEPKKRIVEGAGIGLLSQNDGDAPIERRAPWLAFGALACALVPFAIWVGYAQQQEYRNFASLPQDFLVRMVSPDHFPLLPRILEGDSGAPEGLEGASFSAKSEDDLLKDPRKQFRKDVIVSQAAYVVSELQKRWRMSEDGIAAASDIELLKFPMPVIEAQNAVDRWKIASEEVAIRRNVMRTNASVDRYYMYQLETPKLGVVTTSERRGSIRVRTLRRIAQIRKMYSGVKSLIQTEQEFLQRYYAENITYKSRVDTERKTPQGVEIEKGVDLGPTFLMPAEAIFFAKPEQRFLWEIARYQSAQAMSEYVTKLDDRWHDVPDTDPKGAWPQRGTVWLERDGALVPAFAGVRPDGEASAETAIVQNAKYSIAEKVIPPPPPPPPRVDEQAVKFVILGKREQIKACYESVLRRRPNAAGNVRVRWTIDALGRAEDAHVVSGTLADAGLQACLVARIEQWQFPKPQNGKVDFEYPFLFATKPR